MVNKLLQSKAAKMSTGAWVLIVVIGALFLNANGTINLGGLLGSAGGSGSGTTTTVTTSGIPCTQSTTLTVNMVERYAESTSMSGQNATVFVNGVNKGVVANGGTMTVSDGNKVTVYFAADPAATTYAAAKSEGTISGCPASVSTGDEATFKDTILGAPAYKLYDISTAPTASVTNLKDYTSNPSTALAIGAGGKETARVSVTWASKEGYGIADGSTLACRFTDSQIDQGATEAVLDGQTLGSAKYIPSATSFALSATNQSVKYWAIPAIDGKVKTSSTLDMIIAGDSNSQPTAATNFSCSLKDSDWFQTNDGTFNVGTEDSDDQAEVGKPASAELSFNIALS